MKLLETIEQVFHVAFGYMASKALFSGLQLGVFDALARGPKGLEALAAETRAEQRPLRTLLITLTAVGLLERRGECWVNGPAAQTHLVKEGPGDFGDYLRYQVDRQMYPFMHNLTDVLRGRHDSVPFADYEAWFSDAAEATLYSESQHSASLAPALMLAALVDLSASRRLLDVGGGSGAFSITLCQQHPELRAAIVDFPNVLEVARRQVAKAGLESRIDLLPGNALDLTWPGGQDVILFSYLSGSVSAEGVAALYRQAFAALDSGGRVLVHDFMADDDLTGPPLAAMWALQHATFTPGATALTPGFVTGCLRDAGFEEVTVVDFVPGMTRLVQARRPG